MKSHFERIYLVIVHLYVTARGAHEMKAKERKCAKGFGSAFLKGILGVIFS
jgi:hypothetical protein